MTQATQAPTTTAAPPQRPQQPADEAGTLLLGVVVGVVAISPLSLVLPWALAIDAPAWRHTLVPVGLMAMPFLVLFAPQLLRRIARILLAAARALDGRDG
jgi:hypothetical protein